MGYCPSICAGSRYRELYRDTGPGRQGWARSKKATIQPGHGHDTASQGPRYGPVRVRHGAQRSRHGPARAQHGFYLLIQFCILTRKGCKMVGPDAVTRRASERVRAATLQGGARDTAEGAVTRRGLALDTSRSRRSTTQRLCATTQPVHTYDTTIIWPRRRPRYGPVRTTTRRCAHGLGAACTQPRLWVCALCTRPSFDSMHCSESLFMNTVHEHCSRGFQKNKIKFYKIN